MWGAVLKHQRYKPLPEYQYLYANQFITMPAVAFPISTSSMKSKPLIRAKLQPSSAVQHVDFDPEKHLSFVERPNTLSLSDIGLPEDAGISPVAVSDPFPLFNEEAIRIMRSELFQEEVWENCIHSTAFAECQIRGSCPK